MNAEYRSTPVARRVVLHFPGFEPLSAEKHRDRYMRAMQKTGELWGLAADVGGLSRDGHCPSFDVVTTRTGAGWTTASRIFVLDHDEIVARLAGRPLLTRLWRGFASAGRVIVEGGAFGYFRHAWRFGLFFAFPFLLVLSALAASAAIAAYPAWLGLGPWHYPLAIALAFGFFLKLFIPWSQRLHTLHLFSDWEMAVAVARLDDSAVNDWIEAAARAARTALDEEADEYLVTSHSMGSSMAVHVIGLLMEREPDLFEGRKVVFVTLGGATLQCALLRSAARLRERVGLIARAGGVTFIEVQCLTDVISFYKSSVTALTGHGDAVSPGLIFLRLRNMLTAERYGRIKRDFLRVHRQYVLGADRATNFDFGLMTGGPLPAASFEAFTASPEEALRAVGSAAAQDIARDGYAAGNR